MTETTPAKNFWKAFGFQHENPEELKKRTSAVNAAIFTIAAGTCYCLIYVLLGFPYVTVAVACYALCSITSLVYLRMTHHFENFKVIQLVLISCFPIATQLSIGGFINGSAVAIAAFIAPATALLYAKAESARRYFYLFVVLIIGAALFESYLIEERQTLPVGVITTFYVINVAATLGIIYFLMESFLKKQEELRVELRQSLENLKATQKQLIQSEKMASLGELTAGIAHEIQNPLNFVNNFSDISGELMEELTLELQKGDLKEARALATDILQNLQKITHHGKRAEGIVKGMLQHSRSSGGQRMPTDINALADEYLRLAYHGLRARDKSFNATLKTDFDETGGKLNIVPQDIGRVLLNLITNAFHAVDEKKKRTHDNYEPTVSIRTRKLADRIEIQVMDNGNGIPQHLIDKIFQPFFTTKPTGQGTGLGLSLAYDIVKAHDGALTVESIEGGGTKFITTIPIK